MTIAVGTLGSTNRRYNTWAEILERCLFGFVDSWSVGATFQAKWMELTDDEREFFKSEVGKATGKS